MAVKTNVSLKNETEQILVALFSISLFEICAISQNFTKLRRFQTEKLKKVLEKSVPPHFLKKN